MEAQVKASRQASTLTLANPDDWARFEVGDTVYLVRTPWWRRLWNFLTNRGGATVVAVNREQGSVTIDVTG